MRSDGLFKLGEPDLWVCSPFQVEAETRDPEQRSWGLLISWHDRDGIRHEEAFARASFSGDCGEVRTRLADAGLSLNGSLAARQAFAEYLNACSSPARAQCVDRTGWHGLGEVQVYVLPGQVFGRPAERVVFQTAEREPNLFTTAGTAMDWMAQVASLCIGNSRLLFAASCGFSGTLLHLLGEDGGGFNLLGSSRTGKSTALRIAASIWGFPGSFTQQWRFTANALEQIARRYSHALLPIDEMAQVDASIAGEVAYMLANGQGKARASRGGLARPAVRFLVMFLSTGEHGLADKNAEAGRTTKAGQEVRLCDIPADAGAGMGVFQNLHGAPSPGAFADELRGATARYHGTAAPAFLTALLDQMDRDPDYAEKLRERVRSTLGGWLHKLPIAAGGQVQSVGFRFAMVAIAGELATEFLVTGWPAGAAAAGVEQCFRAWLAERGTLGAREDELAVSQLRDFILKHGSSRFERWEEPDDAQQVPSAPAERFRAINRAGWRRAESTPGMSRWVYYVTSPAMREALLGLNFRDAVGLLVERGHLTRDRAGKASQAVSPPGHEKIRCYIVSGSLLSAELDEAA